MYRWNSLLLLVSVCFIVSGQGRKSIASILPEEWAALNRTISGRLGRGRPAGQPCFTSIKDSTFDLAACSDVLRNSRDSKWIASNFGAYDNIHWGSCMNPKESCYVSEAIPLLGECYQGMVPEFYVAARGAEDIVETLRFVQKHDINLVVRNSGHDYRGRSTGNNALAIWTHNIQPDIQVHEDFTPEGCSAAAGSALTLGAGQGFEGLYKKAHEHGYMVVGGTSPTVGASGGWLTGGGHSALSQTYGLGVDNALQIRAVTPNGTVMTTNRCQNTDLFFALRGGGGNAFGIIIETTTRAHKEVPLQGAFIAGISLNPEASKKIRDIFIDNTPTWSRDGWGGYGAAFGPVGFVSFITPKLNAQEAKESMAPLTEYLSSLGNLSVPVAMQFSSYANYMEYYNSPVAQALSQQGVGTGMVTSSRLIEKRLFEQETGRAQLSEAMGEIIDGVFAGRMDPFGILLVPPAAYTLESTDIEGGPGEASFNPVWRTSYWHALFAGSFDPAVQDASEAFTKVSKSADPLRRITPGGGAYLNEGDAFEPDEQTSFWGKNHGRLVSIKREMDPHNVLTCHQCLGWESSDERWSCFPKVLNR